MGLKITIETKLTVVDYLDTTLNLNEGTFMPYRKPLDTPQYINCQSNHPKTVLQQVPLSVERRLNDISSNKEVFDGAKIEYETALKNSGFKHTLKWTDNRPRNPAKAKRRRRDVIWFNPPFNKSLKTNIGKQFLGLINKNFPATNQLSEILNRQTIKMSYSCHENMESKIKKHNNKLLSETKPEAENSCNCRDKSKCPVKNKCLTETVIYKAKVQYEQVEMEYIGLTDNPFKTRFNEHTHTFRNERKKKATTLANFVWDKGLNPLPTIKWSILQKCRRYSPGQKTCNLCLTEKLHIVKKYEQSKVTKQKSGRGKQMYQA